ncbi:MAG TPA: HoxN/HupN/NixA family nickel/cobalt transporter [Candidatus Tumulicola sp.]|jgi:high-affinity nickel-transport protein
MSRAFSLAGLRHVADNASPRIRRDIARMYAVLTAFNLGVWACAFALFHRHPVMLGTSLLAYSFGLRHAVDADHISAIDNVTRKLVQDGQRPVATGFFFSLGHSTIVLALTVAIAIGATYVKHNLPNLESAGSSIGTLVSALFLFAIAILNAFVLADVLGAFGEVRAGRVYREENVERSLQRRGLLGRMFAPLMRMVDRSWKMYPIGVLFGLGFDTATEVGLLGIAAVESGKGMPVGAILVFPLLFAAGMSLLDTTDGILMLGAYGWAFVKPIRKLYYNAVITFASVFIAVAVGAAEVLGMLVDRLHLSGPLWDAVGSFNDHLGMVGFALVGSFVAIWVFAAIVYRLRGWDVIEAGTAPEA